MSLIPSPKILSGEVVLTTSATPLPNVQIGGWVYLQANSANAGLIHVGSEGVTASAKTNTTTAGIPLAAGARTEKFYVENLSVFSAVAATAGDSVLYIATRN
jgi:hypothetical protein